MIWSESLKSTKSQIVADFFVEHRVSVEQDLDVNLIFLTRWKLYFDGSACNDGQGIEIIFISPSGARFEILLFGLEILESMGVKHVEDFGDSMLIMHRFFGKYQCLDGSLNAYLDKCLDAIARFDEFSIYHIYRHENSNSNDLAQQASGYSDSSKNFRITKKLMCAHVQNLESSSVLNVETGLAGCLIGLSGAQTDLTNRPTGRTGPVISDSFDLVPRVDNSTSDNLKHDKADVVD
jgi:hypothetical protein